MSTTSAARPTRRRLTTLLATTVFSAAVATALAGPALAGPPAQDAWPTSPAVDGAYGLDFHDGVLYVAQRGRGIATVTADGVTTQIVSGPEDVMGIALAANGDIYFTMDSSPEVRRIDAADLAAHAADYLEADWLARTTLVATSPDGTVMGLERADDGTLYVSAYNSKQLYRISGSTVTPLLSDPHIFFGMDIAPSGDLYVVDYRTYEFYRVDAADLAAGGVTDADLTDLGEADGPCGLAFFADGTTYYQSDCFSITKLSLPPADPGTDQPDAPDTDEPDTDQPGTDQPGTDQPGTDQPDTDTPDTDEPVVTPPVPVTPVTPEPVATPAPQGGTPAGSGAQVTRATLVPGEVQTITGTGFLPGERVHGVLHSTPVDLGWATADAQGVATFTVTLPAGFEPGAHSVTMRGETSGIEVSAAFTVGEVPAAPAPSTTGLAYTGASVALPLTGGALLLAGGTALVVVGRRRRAA
jgi:hypothetical protein